MSNDRGDHQSGEHTDMSRRQLLRAASGSFALAASGLFLPPVLEQAAARPGANGGELGGRRGRNRRGRNKPQHRDKNRTNAKRQKNKRGTPRGSTHIKWIKFYVYNDRPVTTPNQSASVRGWANMHGDIGEPWDRLPLVSVANGTYTGEFEMFEYEEGAVVVDDRYYVEADNSLLPPFPPLLRLYYGGTMTNQGYEGGTRVVEGYALAEDDQYETTIEGHRFTIKRLYDTNDYKVYDIRFT